jgi:hypothetical protein
MTHRLLPTLLLLPVLAFAGCGKDEDKVDVASYTCGEFNKSLRTKDDNTSGRFINELRKQANLGQEEKAERRTITLGIYFTCRGKPASTRPAKDAVAAAKKIKAGTFKAPDAPDSDKKKSTE